MKRRVDADETVDDGGDVHHDGGATAVDTHRVTAAQVVTLGGPVVVVVLTLTLDLGFVALTLAVVLALMSPRANKDAIQQISWSTVLLVTGVLTYVSVLQAAGSVAYVGDAIAGLGVPLLAALRLCYLGGVVSAFASSTAIIGVTIALAAPFMAQGEVSVVGLLCALSVASTIVDVSPFSTNGALVLANAPENLDRDVFYRRILNYAIAVTLIDPLVAWLAYVVVPDFF